MIPSDLAKNGSEAGHQTALFAWVAVARLRGFQIAWQWAEGQDVGKWDGGRVVLEELAWLFHIPNGGSRGGDKEGAMIRGAQLKAQGVKKGVADLMLPLRRGSWPGLFIEMKKPSEKSMTGKGKGGMSVEQVEFMEFVKSQGYGFLTAYSWEEAAKAIESYYLWGH